jgi:hypothetical protein
MPRWFATHTTWSRHSLPAEVLIFVLVAFSAMVALQAKARAQSPALTTISGAVYLPDLTNAAITNVTSTTVTIDVGFVPVAGGGIEVRYSDAGWGVDNDRNLIGRFTSRSFTLTRYARGQSYFLKGYDGSSPPKYSRYAAALYVDYPL